MKAILFFATLLLVAAPTHLFSQLRLTRAEIIANKGINFTSQETADGRTYLFYTTQMKDKDIGEYTKAICFYLNEDGVCDLVQIIVPASLYVSWVASFNQMYKKIDSWAWEDGGVNNSV